DLLLQGLLASAGGARVRHRYFLWNLQLPYEPAAGRRGRQIVQPGKHAAKLIAQMLSTRLPFHLDSIHGPVAPCRRHELAIDFLPQPVKVIEQKGPPAFGCSRAITLGNDPFPGPDAQCRRWSIAADAHFTSGPKLVVQEFQVRLARPDGIPEQ